MIMGSHACRSAMLMLDYKGIGYELEAYGTSDAHLLMAASVVCMLPCLILFFAMQKYFVESISMTGLKS